MRSSQPLLGGRIALFALFLASVAGTSLAGGSIVVAHAGQVFSSVTDGAVYRIPDNGPIETLASGQPLTSPSGILPAPGGAYYVAALGRLFSANQDGAVFLVGSAAPIRSCTRRAAFSAAER